MFMNLMMTMMAMMVLMTKEIYKVSETDFTVHVNMFLTFVWQDNRLNFTLTKETTADVDEEFIKSIWTPDFYIYHLKEFERPNGVTSMRGLTVKKRGDSIDLIYSMETNVKFTCSMNFDAFPFQSNKCKFRLTSYTFTADQMVFKALTSKRPDKRLTMEKVRDYDVEVKYLDGNDTLQIGDMLKSDGAGYSVVGLQITLTNLHSKYMWVYYLPTSMFTITSWVSASMLIDGNNNDYRFLFCYRPLPIQLERPFSSQFFSARCCRN